MLTLVIFLVVGGHRAMLQGVHASFKMLPLLSLGIESSRCSTCWSDLFTAATMLAIQLAAPMLVTMLVVDLVLGLIGKTMPQMNVMSAALSLRVGGGNVVVIWLGLTLTRQRDRAARSIDSMEQVRTDGRRQCDGSG